MPTKNARMADPDGDADGYEFVPAKYVPVDRLNEFARAVLPDATGNRCGDEWWRATGDECCVAAVHGRSGAVAALCAGRPSRWFINGSEIEAVAICGWYVAPGHGGRSLGRRTLASLRTEGRFVYAFSISELAISAFRKVGWTGPVQTTLSIQALPGIFRHCYRQGTRSADLTSTRYGIEAGIVPEGLAAAFDHIDAQDLAQARMCRDCREWRWRLSIRPHRFYAISVAERNGVPAGYVAVREPTPGKSRLLDRLHAALVVDLNAPGDDPAVLELLAREASALAAGLGARAILAATISPAHRNAFHAAGHFSSATPVVGSILRRSAPKMMWLATGAGANIDPDHLMLSFADSDVDLNL